MLGAKCKEAKAKTDLENGVHVHPKWFLLNPSVRVSRFAHSAKLLAAWHRAWARHYSRPVSVKMCISSNIDNDKNVPELLFTTCSVTLPLYESLKNGLSKGVFVCFVLVFFLYQLYQIRLNRYWEWFRISELLRQLCFLFYLCNLKGKSATLKGIKDIWSGYIGNHFLLFLAPGGIFPKPSLTEDHCKVMNSDKKLFVPERYRCCLRSR